MHQFQVGDLVCVIQNGEAPFVPECMVFEINDFSIDRECGPMAQVVDAGGNKDGPRLTFWAFVNRLRHASPGEWDKEEI